MGSWLYPEARFNAKVLEERADISETMHRWWFRLSKKILGLIPLMTLEGTEFESSFKNVQCSLHSYYLCISFQFHLVNICQLSSRRLYPKQVKLKLSAEKLPRRKYWRLIYFKITCLTLLSGYTFLFYFKILLDSCY